MLSTPCEFHREIKPRLAIEFAIALFIEPDALFATKNCCQDFPTACAILVVQSLSAVLHASWAS